VIEMLLVFAFLAVGFFGMWGIERVGIWRHNRRFLRNSRRS
jgi:hypothetical protein